MFYYYLTEFPHTLLINHQENLDSVNRQLWQRNLYSSFIWESVWGKTLIVSTELQCGTFVINPLAVMT
jgi:hypothetical protein